MPVDACCRTVLGLLPRVDLRLPDDPPGVLHSVSCLMEAVVHDNDGTLPEGGGDSRSDLAGQQPAEQQLLTGQLTVAVRLTLFASGKRCRALGVALFNSALGGAC